MRRTKLILIPILALLLVSGCMTRNPETGEQMLDEEATEALVAAFRGAVAQGVFEVVRKHPDLAPYFQDAAAALCEMRDGGDFDPDAILKRLDLIATQKGLFDDPWVFQGKNLIITLYRVSYARRFRVAMEPTEWQIHVLTVLCGGITDGIQGAIPPTENPPT